MGLAPVVESCTDTALDDTPLDDTALDAAALGSVFGAVGASAAQAWMPTTAATRISARAIRRMGPPY
jgi:hypothetical protein